MTPAYGDSPEREFERLQARYERLLGDRSQFQLILRLMELLNPLVGLENMLRGMVYSIGECIGGTNIEIYYWIGAELHYLDAQGSARIVTAIDDPDVVQVIESRQFVERHGPPEETLVVANCMPRVSWNGTFPLLAGQELIGVIKLENMHIRGTSLERYLPTFFSHAALILSNEIRNYIRHKAETALAESEAMYRSLVAAMAEGVIIQNAEGKLTAINPAGERMLGCSADEIVGRHRPNPRWKTIHEDGTRFPANQHPPFVALRTGVPSTNVVMGIHRKDGALIWLSINSQPLTFEGETKPHAVVSTFHDITERKRAEDEVRSLNQDLERHVAQRTADLERTNQELEAFSYSVSHDLRAPLRAIDGFSQILVNEYEGRLDEEGRRYLATIRRSATRMGHLIDDLLNFARTSRSEMSLAAVDMAALTQEVFDEVRAAAPERSIVLHLGDMPPAGADRVLIRQVLFNLLSNAVKFTARQSEAVIEVGGSAESGSENVYYVRDNGAGFDMQYVNNLFGVFQRLHAAEDFSGTGIGLAIVKRIVVRHGGRVWAEGRVNQGATVYFTLPGVE